MSESSPPTSSRVESTSSDNKTASIRFAIVLATLINVVVAGRYYVNASESLGVHAALRWTSIFFFLLLFVWISLSFYMAIAGFLSVVIQRIRQSDAQTAPENDALSFCGSVECRTAILMPVYNESIGRVMAGVRAMIDSLHDCLNEPNTEGNAKTAADFDFFILSDSTQHECWLAEEFAFQELLVQLASEYPEHTPNVYYRHRSKNIARKAGNIADFCTHWGTDYEFMVVLDADSLIDGQTLLAMRNRMAADPKLGILQVPPVPIGRHSLFARLQQFAAQAYGAVFAKGYALWSGESGNYWGHNAIIRVEPFSRFCNLPVLPGKAPLGGEILSHDFVEAALMLRAEYHVEMANDLSGSYEECPTTLADYLVRDQRWCQGNMQHFRLIFSKNFHPLSRFHFINGFLSYAMAPLWLLFVLLTLLIAGLSDATGNGDAANRIALTLFIASMAMLLLPKMFGVAANIITGKAARFGGVLAIIGSALLEIICSIVIAPIIAVFYSRFVIGVLRGKNIKWSAQQRDEHRVTLGDSWQQFGFPMIAAIVVTTLIVACIPSVLGWTMPMLFGLLLAVPVAMVMSSREFGRWLRSKSMLLIPEEVQPPEVVRRHQQLLAATDLVVAARDGNRTLFDQLVNDRGRIRKHCQMLREVGCDVPVDETLRRKIDDDHETPVQLDRSLNAKEKFAVLSDLQMMERFSEQTTH